MVDRRLRFGDYGWIGVILSSKPYAMELKRLLPQEGLYDPSLEHDSCGVGFVCHLDGKASNALVQQGLQVLENMEHRGACGCDPNSGDGAGILVKLPDKFLRLKCREIGIELPSQGQYAVATCFLPKDLASRHECEQALEQTAREYNLEILGWRDVPTNPAGVGEMPLSAEPLIRQCFVAPGESFYNRADFDRRLYLVRQHAENLVEFAPWYSNVSHEQFYISMLSATRMVYKGMLTAPQLRTYFPDLSDPNFESSLALVHSRFSTNTWPAWRLAHPYRYLAHNGEINTLCGNRNWMRAQYKSLHSDVFGDELAKMFPILTESGSDSATLDNALQFLCVNGRSLPHAILMLIPEAWQNDQLMDDDLRAFYEYHACLMEPWDGPAAVLFTNGTLVGGMLDRNGLRPARYYVTTDGLVVMASEVGVLPIVPEKILRKGRLQPGKIFLIDMDQHRIIEDHEVKQELTEKRPWRRWLKKHLLSIEELPTPPRASAPDSQSEPLLTRHQVFGYTVEDLNIIIQGMASQAQEPLGSMGADTPLACLSDKPQLLYNYFKQRFAQVTNPPLDANFEALVTSLISYIGPSANLLAEKPESCRLIKLKTPIITNEELTKLRALSKAPFKATTLPALFDGRRGGAALETALEELCSAAAAAVREGSSILILSDRPHNKDRAPIPALLATSAVHHHLIREGTRTQASLIVETGEAREVHHFCLLTGYGASAVNPFLALESIDDSAAQGLLPAKLSAEEAKANYIRAANKGVLKVASKMGISTLQSYHGAQIFEALGLSKKVIDRYFTNTISRLNGVDLDVIAREVLERHRTAYFLAPVEGQPLSPGGFYRWRKGEEYHMWNPDTIAKLQHAVRSNSYEAFKEYSRLADNEQTLCTLRGLLTFKEREPVPLEEVEPAEQIVRRFVTGAMSFGSISKEAHETIALAMNQIGGKSNTGEGGEDPERFDTVPGGSSRRSAIKQIASGRFGVTSEYLVNADELQIKMAQGAKPGEGGQLPGHKVDRFIGKVRHTTPGVGLISPPPHHDIYSIEDLAQLIHDLKNVNPAARISVKLVSETGVGTIASGVVKAKADHILISGDSGGTGASPLTSIKHAGLPWELGLSETQQTLLLHRLRGRVRLQTDGQIKTGRDVAIAFLLGAEEVGFSTAPLIASGCVMMRACHLNTCPVGIATQDPELRQKFSGKPEHIVHFMFFVAQEVREIMASLGFRRVDDMVGRVECLQSRDLSGHWKARSLDLSPIMHCPKEAHDCFRYRTEAQDHALDKVLDNELLKLAAPALESGAQVRHELPVCNVNRSVGAMLSGVVAKKYGFQGLPDETVHFKLKGSAGQSFGAFLARGIRLTLEGDCNDYLGKGLSGGRLVIFPPKEASFKAEENVIAGNVICYGGIAGDLYIRGVVGERFCVRNSGAEAVAEGVGDHGCEYMTGGRVVILGPVGRNFAAGMSGGIAYVFDPNGSFRRCCNQDTVELGPLSESGDISTVRRLIENHARLTGSTIAAAISENWGREVRHFIRVMPVEYKRVLDEQTRPVGEAENSTGYQGVAGWAR